jgi:hypothetical protein
VARDVPSQGAADAVERITRVVPRGTSSDAIVTTLGYSQALGRITDANLVGALEHLADELRRLYADDEDLPVLLEMLGIKRRRLAREHRPRSSCQINRMRKTRATSRFPSGMRDGTSLVPNPP